MIKSSFLRSFFPIVFTLIVLTTFCLSEECNDGSCINPDTVRVISMEELSTKIGKDDEGDVWISVLGQVFDVTEGREFYGEGTSYSIFAGQDASSCFATGDFDDEGAKKDLEDLDDGQIKAVDHWKQFYWDEEKYSFVGVLDGLYYNKDGNPTSKLNRIQKRISAIKSAKKS